MYADTKLGFEKRENVLQREKRDLVQRANELEQQYKTLLEQFTQLSDKMSAIQSKIQNPAVSRRTLTQELLLQLFINEKKIRYLLKNRSMMTRLVDTI